MENTKTMSPPERGDRDIITENNVLFSKFSCIIGNIFVCLTKSEKILKGYPFLIVCVNFSDGNELQENLNNAMM